MELPVALFARFAARFSFMVLTGSFLVCFLLSMPLLELLGPLGSVRARAMFGGFGIYRGDVMFAIIVDDRLYFKADSATRASFTAHGLSPFTYAARGKKISLQYYEAPPEVSEEPEAMRNWAEQAIGTALNAKRGKKSPKKRRG